MPYLLLLKLGLVAILLGGGVLGVHKYNDHFREEGRAEVREEYKDKLIAAQDAAQKETAALNQKIKEANNAANRRNKQIDEAHAAANSANTSLQSALDHLRLSVPSATAASLANSVTTLSTVFGQCATEYGSLAVISDRHSNDAQRCIESWPTKGEVK